MALLLSESNVVTSYRGTNSPTVKGKIAKVKSRSRPLFRKA